ncbi:SIR2 family protein [Neptuniibacter sp. QD72_48]|uniref:SIR2 family protein n=1 Tax=Neptuniibacter sp. QD72_48 TaxID=3398214 RepID=UPI0039F4C570
MKFHSDGPSIPDILLERCDAGRVVFLCGAGVSSPSGMPDFIGLTRYVIEFFDPPEESEVMTAFQPWLDDPAGANMPLDQIFNLLHQEYGKDEVNALVSERLRVPSEADGVGREHGLIKRISSSQSGMPQIVTTNFDLLFEGGDDNLLPYVPPSFPDLDFGTTIEGVTYLHGRLADESSVHHPYVLSSADFGRAYLSEGWATKFIRGLLERYTVVLVGYKAEDPPVKYLLQGLNHDGKYDSSRLYAFERGVPVDIEAKWRDRGVTAIGYSEHSALWETMEAWAVRSDDPRRWRASVIETSLMDPKSMLPFERGQVAHVLRTVQGAKLFSELRPIAHPEWICVLDGHLRLADKSRGYGEDAEEFDPVVEYGLDDDLQQLLDTGLRERTSTDNLLSWRDGDDNPSESHHLSGAYSGAFQVIPVRLGHLATWISASVHSPVLAWWAARQISLHPRLLEHIEWEVRRSEGLHERARHAWNLIIEYHRASDGGQWRGDWFDFKKRVNVEGWSPSVLRAFRKVASPRLKIGARLGLAGSKPPEGDWEGVSLRDLGVFEIHMLERHGEELEVPDEVLPTVFSILEEQLIFAAGLLEEVESTGVSMPILYPEREVDGKPFVDDIAEVLALFVQLFERLSDLQPELAASHAVIWSANDRYFFRKLKLFALSKGHLFSAEDVVEAVLALDQDAFWDSDVVRELLFLLSDRWGEFTENHCNRLLDRILAGPDQLAHWSDDEYPEKSNVRSAQYGKYLELQGAVLPLVQFERLTLLIEKIPRWADSWASSIVVENGSHGGWIGTDENPEVLLDLPVNEVLVQAEGQLNRDFRSLTDKRPFAGLVKTNPRKALLALSLAGKKGEYRQEFWSSLIVGIPEDVSLRLRYVFLRRISRLPREVVVGLRYDLGRWLEKNLASIIALDEHLGWAVYDHVVEGIQSAACEAQGSDLGEIFLDGGAIERSNRTYHHACNGPLGMCVNALYSAVPGEQQEANSLIPEPVKSRIELLFDAPREGRDHAVSITMSKLNWLMFVDPSWVRARLLPMLSFEYSASEPAWSGLLHSGGGLSPTLAKEIKPLLLDLFPWIDGFSWDKDESQIAAQWLGFMRIFYPDAPEGLTKGEMRNVLRSISDGARNRFIFWLGKVGDSNENGWGQLVIPFIDEVWPRERKYRTAVSVRAWVCLLTDAGESFPLVYQVVRKFLVPVETGEHSFHMFAREVNGQSLTARYPEVVLDLMDVVTPRVLAKLPYELPKVLDVIAESDRALTSDPRYLRLLDLVERS